MTIVETHPITGGVDTHLDVHVAAALDVNGGTLGVESFPTTPCCAPFERPRHVDRTAPPVRRVPLARGDEPLTT